MADSDNKIPEGLRKYLLAHIGAAAIVAEKSKGVVDDFIKKGEETVAEGKAVNEELKRKKESEKRFSEAASTGNYEEMLSHMSEEQKKALYEQLKKDAEAEMAKEGGDKASGDDGDVKID